jgi:hypothetical protein
VGDGLGDANVAGGAGCGCGCGGVGDGLGEGLAGGAGAGTGGVGCELAPQLAGQFASLTRFTATEQTCSNSSQQHSRSEQARSKYVAAMLELHTAGYPPAIASLLTG